MGSGIPPVDRDWEKLNLQPDKIDELWKDCKAFSENGMVFAIDIPSREEFQWAAYSAYFVSQLSKASMDPNDTQPFENIISFCTQGLSHCPTDTSLPAFLLVISAGMQMLLFEKCKDIAVISAAIESTEKALDLLLADDFRCVDALILRAICLLARFEGEKCQNIKDLEEAMELGRHLELFLPGWERPELEGDLLHHLARVHLLKFLTGTVQDFDLRTKAEQYATAAISASSTFTRELQKEITLNQTLVDPSSSPQQNFHRFNIMRDYMDNPATKLHWSKLSRLSQQRNGDDPHSGDQEEVEFSIYEDAETIHLGLRLGLGDSFQMAKFYRNLGKRTGAVGRNRSSSSNRRQVAMLSSLVYSNPLPNGFSGE